MSTVQIRVPDNSGEVADEFFEAEVLTTVQGRPAEVRFHDWTVWLGFDGMAVVRDEFGSFTYSLA